MGSILADVKKGIGVPEWDDGFDPEIVIFINAALFTLAQLGVGPPGGISITGSEETWDSIVEGRIDLDAVRTYVILKTRLAFDPPSTSFVIDAINNQISELEWRLNVQIEGAFSGAE